MRRRKLWCFRMLAMLGGPAVLLTALLLAEIALRAAGSGCEAGFYLAETVNGQTVYYNNPHFSNKYFGPALKRPSVPFQLSKKPSDVVRIFVLGGSAARGFPQPAFGMARHLEVALAKQYPGARFEVVNAAVTAINSHVVREIARDCAQLEPDLFVVYLGNNEVVGPFGPGTVFDSLTASRTLIRSSVAVRSTRVGQAAVATLRRLGSGKSSHWQGMGMFLGNQVACRDPRLTTMYRHFSANLRDICRSARSAGVPVILCTVATNEKDCAPFESQHADHLTAAELQRWQAIELEGQRRQRQGQWAAARECYEAASEIDSEHAQLIYDLATCCWQLGEYGPASELFVRARDLDTLRFRADRQINAVIRQVACSQTSGVYLFDAEGELRRRSPHGALGSDHLYEHVHLRFSGNYAIAAGLLEPIHGLLPVAVQRCLSADPIELEDCRRQLAFSKLEELEALETILTVTARPPFRSTSHLAERRQLEQEALQLRRELATSGLAESLGTHRAAVAGAQPHWMLHDRYAALLFRHARDLAAAEHHWRAALEVVPNSQEINHHLAVALAAQQRPDESLPFFEKALMAAPHSPSVLLNFARALTDQGRFERAESLLRSAERLRPLDAAPHLAWADLRARQGRLSAAIESYERACELDPSDRAARLAAAQLHQQLAKRTSTRGARRP